MFWKESDMRRVIGYVRKHLDSWDDICINDKARLRLSLILFSLAIAIVFLAMAVHTFITVGFLAAASSILFGGASLFLFLWQFHRKEYCMISAWLLGALSLVMAVYFTISNGLEGPSHIWITLLPIMSTMVLPFWHSFIYNGALLALLIWLLKNPQHSHMPEDYGPHMRIIFLLSIMILALCNYTSEYIRRRTQKQLIIMTEKYRDSSLTDPLTGAYNRRALTSHFGGMEEPAHGLSFAMLDLDFFKKVNDTYGHEIGDKLLRHIVAIVKKVIPPGAQLYRWGGEEFLIILKSSSIDILHDVSENIRKVVASTPLPISIQEGEPPELLAATVSIGGTVASRQDNIEQSIGQADEQMYLAKGSGRNKVMVSLI